MDTLIRFSNLNLTSLFRFLVFFLSLRNTDFQGYYFNNNIHEKVMGYFSDKVYQTLYEFMIVKFFLGVNAEKSDLKIPIPCHYHN